MTLLAKSDPPRSLLHHALDVQAMVQQYAIRWPHLAHLAQAPELFEDAALIALWHDLGKAAASFQAILQGRKNETARCWNHYRHEILSGAIVATLPPSRRRDDLLLAVLTHHLGMNRDAWTEQSLYRFAPSQDKAISFSERLAQLEVHWDELLSIIQSLQEQAHQNVQTSWFALPADPTMLPDPFKILEQSVGDTSTSRPNRSRQRGRGVILKRVYLRGLLMAADHLASAAVSEHLADKVDIVASLPQPARVIPEDFDFVLHRHQVKCARSGSVLLNAPTGSGKTEAALLWAEANQNAQRSRHIFYVLPYTASINAMYQRLRARLGDAVSLLHGRSSYFLYRWLCEEGEESYQAMNKARNLHQQTKELYYPIKVLTPHQILMAFLGFKGWEKAWCEYSGGLFILDEIHAYEPQLMGLLFEMLRRLTHQLEARVCVMSATFPAPLQTRLRKCLTEPFLVELEPQERDRYTRHRIRVVLGSVQDQIPEILRRLQEGQRVLVVLNTVQGAMAAYEALRDRADNPCLLHGQLTLADRQEAEARLDKHAAPPVDLLVGTQAIEVSLDVDFDVLFSDPAPLDALLQRFGRVNRKPLNVLESSSLEERFRDAIICRNQWPETWPIYEQGDEAGHRLVQESLSVLTRNELLREGEVQILMDEVYGSKHLEPFFAIAEEKARRLSELIDQLEPGSELERDESDLLDKMIDAIPIVPVQFQEIHQELLAEKRFFDAQDYTLNISKKRYHALKNNGQIDSLNRHYYGLCHYEPGIGPQFDTRIEPKINIL